MNLWLLEKNFAADYKRVIESFHKHGFPLLGMEQRIQGMVTGSQEEKKLYKVNDQNEAIIPITGVLTNKRSFWDMLLGYAASLTYDEIIQATAEANADPYVKKLTYVFDTPGGSVMGCDDAAVAIAMSEKPTEAVVRGMMCSGGYYLGSQADKITAVSEGAVIGSIGVMVSFYTDPDMVTLTSSNAPKKAPDVTTKRGKDMVIEGLDEMEAMFYQRISEGRGVTTDFIKENYGQGGTMLAKRALASGMIDKIETSRLTLVRRAGMTSDSEENQSLNVEPKIQMGTQLLSSKTEPTVSKTETVQTESSPIQSGQKPKEKKRMDLETLKIQHPEVFAQAVKIGEENGKKMEAERIQAFQDYMDADPENEKLQVICKTEMQAGKTVEQVRPKLDVAIRDGKLAKESNAGSVATQSVDSAEVNASIVTEPTAEVYDAKKRREELKAMGAFKI